MSEPLVVAVMLVNGRPDMTARAVRSFRAQDYPRKRLVIWDTGYPECGIAESDDVWVPTVYTPAFTGASIGALRNAANKFAIAHYFLPSAPEAEIVCHFDSDDVSGPSRISEQVALLQASGADAVGYSQALFYRPTRLLNPELHDMDCYEPGTAWLYTAPAGAQALGASLMFWRKTWERQPFRDVTHGEDLHFQLGLKVEAVSSLAWTHPDGGPTWMPSYDVNNPPKPRLICTVHGGNTSTQINPAKKEWARAAEWDKYCRSTIKP